MAGTNWRRQRSHLRLLRSDSLPTMAESSATAHLLTDRLQRAFAGARRQRGRRHRRPLHDAVEDFADGAQIEACIRRESGDRVAGIVMGCSDAVAVTGQPKAPWRDRESRYLEHLGAEQDPVVLLVSACDTLHNARSSRTSARSGPRCGSPSARRILPPSSGTTSPWPPRTAAVSPPACRAS